MKNKMIKSVAVVLSAMMLMATPIYAQNRVQDREIGGMNYGRLPRFTYIATVSNSLSISAEGKAEVAASVHGYPDVTKVIMKSTLQKYKDNKWVEVNTWTIYKSDTYASIAKSYTVDKGYDYRLETTYNVYSGSDVETHTKTTKTVSYK